MTLLRISMMLTVIACCTIASADRPPNIVFVLADDLGWAELGCYGNEFHETQHIDRLAQQGVRLTQAYATAPVCSPYRASLMTGQLPARHGVLDYLRPNSGRPLSTAHVTLPEVLKQHGYATGMIGKWHLTGYEFHGAEREVRALHHGFAEEIGSPVKGVGNGANFFPYVFRDQPISWLRFPTSRLGEKEYLTDRMNLEAVEFIERHQDEPFFLYLSHFAPHSILNGKPDLVDRYRRKHAPGPSTRTKCYLCEDAGHGQGDPLNHWAGDHNPHLASMLHSIDDGVGMIAAKLRELNLADDTIFIFTSDNGGESNVTSNAPLRGGKSELYEGGIRVPLIVKWPGELPAGTISAQPTINADFYPTLLDAVGAAVPDEQTIDGQSILSQLRSPGAPSDRGPLFWHYPLDKPHFLGGRSAGAIRDGDWKLIEFFDTEEVELYSLKDDVGEATNMADDQPATVTRLKSQLTKWRREIGVHEHDGPLMVEPRGLVFEDSFEPGTVSERWFFQKEWTVEDGCLHRNEVDGTNKRIFLKKPEFQDVVIRFDFRFDSAAEIRLMTGSSGHYNTVVHIRRDQFFIQTADDRTAPYFPSFQGECAFDFEPGKWYTMTLEFAGDEAIAHVDHEHVVMAQHPIIDQQRTYFAIQVDKTGASFDNVEILTAKRRREWNTERNDWWKKQEARAPVAREPQERYQMLKATTLDDLYRNDQKFRDLVQAVREAKRTEQETFPQVFQSLKQRKKKIGEYRKHLTDNDPQYKALRDSVHRTERETVTWLESRTPDIPDRTAPQYPAALERARRRHNQTPEYQALLRRREQHQRELERAYPKLFVTDEQLKSRQQAAREAHKNDAVFKATIKLTSDAVRAERNYLLAADEELAELHRQLFEKPRKN